MCPMDICLIYIYTHPEELLVCVEGKAAKNVYVDLWL